MPSTLKPHLKANESVLVNHRHYRTVWIKGPIVYLIDQNLLPFKFKIIKSRNYLETCAAIKDMSVRGAGAIGTAAGFAMAQAFLSGSNAAKAKKEIEATRPTAQNLFYAVNRVFKSADPVTEAQKIADEDVESCKKIGLFGSKALIKYKNFLSHCNAGWLAFTDFGTALSPLYQLKRNGKKIFVYVSETRPRGQGARLTAWELKNENVPHTIIADGASAFLMRLGKIDAVIVGADRIAENGDVANKIGTLEKAVIAKKFDVPFYVTAPTSTIDLNCKKGSDIPIEYRNAEEVLYQSGPAKSGKIVRVRVSSPGSGALNPAFDVTPAEYISGIITEKGLIKPNKYSIRKVAD